MNKITFFTVLFLLFCINHTKAQDTISLTNLIVKKNNIEYEINEVITGVDLTYLSDEYSADSTLFIYQDKLFTGVGLISDSSQYTLINFKKGRLHGLWFDIMYWNSYILNKGKFKNGLKHGEWIDGSANAFRETTSIYKTEVYKKGILDGPQRYYGSYNGLYTNEGYQELVYKNGELVGANVFHNLDHTLKTSKDTVSGWDNTEITINTFKNGLLTRQETLRNDTIFQIKEFEAYNLTYNLLVTNFHKNGVIESTGQLHDYWRKSGEWLFYNNNGVLVKKEYWEWPSGWYNSHKTKTTFFNTDGSIDKTIKQ